MNSNEIHKAFTENNIDCIIIQPPMEFDDSMEMIGKAWRQMALESLNNEANICKELMKND